MGFRKSIFAVCLSLTTLSVLVSGCDKASAPSEAEMPPQSQVAQTQPITSSKGDTQADLLDKTLQSPVNAQSSSSRNGNPPAMGGRGPHGQQNIPRD